MNTSCVCVVCGDERPTDTDSIQVQHGIEGSSKNTGSEVLDAGGYFQDQEFYFFSK